MKKIKKEVVVYKEYFVAYDGKQFDNEEECKAWETSYGCKLMEKWNDIKKVKVDTGDIELPWGSSDEECYILKPRNLEEIFNINAYLAYYAAEKEGLLTAKHIGKTLALNLGYCHDFCDVYILSDHITRIQAFIAKKESELEVKMQD